MRVWRDRASIEDQGAERNDPAWRQVGRRKGRASGGSRPIDHGLGRFGKLASQVGIDQAVPHRALDPDLHGLGAGGVGQPTGALPSPVLRVAACSRRPPGGSPDTYPGATRSETAQERPSGTICGHTPYPAWPTSSRLLDIHVRSYRPETPV
jgi:hypothetical protein